MDIWDVRDRLIEDLPVLTTAFVDIRDARVKESVEQQLALKVAAQVGHLPQVQAAIHELSR